MDAPQHIVQPVPRQKQQHADHKSDLGGNDRGVGFIWRDDRRHIQFRRNRPRRLHQQRVGKIGQKFEFESDQRDQQRR